MHAEETLRVDAVAADLPPELRRDSGELDRQVRLAGDFLPVHSARLMLRRRDEEQVLSVYLVHDRFKVAEVDDAFVRRAAHHERREDRREALLQHVVEGERQEGLVQPDEVPQQIDETGARDLPGPFEVREMQRLEQLAVGLEFKIDLPRGAPSSDLDVLRVVLADGDALMEEVWEPEESFADLRREFVDGRVERVDPLWKVGGLFAVLVRRFARLLGIRDFPSDFVPPTLEPVGFREGLAPLVVPPNHIVEELRFFRRIALREVLADELGGLPDEPNVQHVGAMRPRLFVGCLRELRVARKRLSLPDDLRGTQ